jgi:amidase
MPFLIRFLLKLSQKKLEKKFAANRVVLHPTPGKLDKIMEDREKYIRDLETFLDDYDLLICPVTMSAAPLHILPHSFKGEMPVFKKGIKVDEKEVYYQKAMACFTIPFSLTGSPVVTLPIGFTKQGLPVGVQLIGKRWKDYELLKNAYEIAKKLDIKCSIPRCINIR